MTYLLSNLGKEPRAGKFGALNRAMVGLVDDFGLVGFETLAVEVGPSLAHSWRELTYVGQDVDDEALACSRPGDRLRVHP